MFAGKSSCRTNRAGPLVKSFRCIVAVFVILPALFGQQDRGSITGTVPDPSGAGAQGISVSIIAPATNFVRETATNRDGKFIETILNTSLFADPATIGRYHRGNTPYRISRLRSRRLLSEEVSLQKNFRLRQSVRFQIRADLLNALNRTLWGNIETNAASPLFGQVTGASNWFTPRKIQFGARVNW